jgi:hypothetical protein
LSYYEKVIDKQVRDEEILAAVTTAVEGEHASTL